MKMNEVDKSKLSPMMMHYLAIKEQYLDVIVFYRLGDFYEMFFEDAILASHELELTLTGRNAGLEERVPMCGVPYHAKDVYVDKLIKKGYKVAICEQLEDPKLAQGVVKRDVTMVLSSGSLINGDSLKENENNYLANVYDYGYCYGLCYVDITTGEIYAELITHNDGKLISTILALSISEIIVNSKVDKKIIDILRNQYKINVTVVIEESTELLYSSIYMSVSEERYIVLVNHLIMYICNGLKREIGHFQKLVIVNEDDYLKMDIHTIRNLELVENLRLKEKNYSLLWLLDHTKTAMGSRKLRTMIEKPLVSMDKINQRYDAISVCLEKFVLCEDLRNYLYEVYDLERLSGRIVLGNCNARDLLQLKSSIAVLPSIKKILEEFKFYLNLETLNELYVLLDQAIYDNPPIGLKEGYLIKEGYSLELDQLKSLRSGGKEFISQFEIAEKEKTGIKNLKVGFNKVFGYYIEISKGNIPLVKDEMGYIRKQTLANCERYITNELKEKEDLILGCEEKIINLEYELFMDIREKIKCFIPVIQQIAKVISEIDVIQSFAWVSEKNNYVRPCLVSTHELAVTKGRHPVVENVIKGEYVPNDVVMDQKTNVLLITGPNMAGKSTYMRELGIIVIMAQIGCFVPALEAKLPIFDQIFTRIGASDDLVSGESTFMVEMLEASNAIKNATINSLILFDELGRGTATFDGMSIASAILEYIHNQIKAKTLFSTHYHELTDLDKTLINLKNMHVSASEENDNIVFLHKVLEGSVDKSYGINVAKLAGLPDIVINRAKEVLKVYEGKEKKRDIVVQTTLPLNFETSTSEVERNLKELDILNLTPMQALNLLSEWKEKIK